MKSALIFAAFVLLAQSGTGAQRAGSPADATVFIRLVGSVHTEVEEAGVRQSFDQDHIEIGTGSGFVISPYGYVLTNEHVIGNSELLLSNGFRKATVTLKVSRIDVCFSPSVLASLNLPSGCSQASVSASDPSVDLAVLFINGSNLPYGALGDSDVVRAGQPVEALGYPLGRQLEVGKVGAAVDLVPEISTTPGAISALRAGDSGERRYLQITSNLNPGNSGGPVVDSDGLAVGVVRMKISSAAGIGFAIPINEVKDFLESYGLDHVLPSRRLRLGPFQNFDGKNIGVRLVEGFGDISPFRVRVESDASAVSLSLRIDRVLSPWSSKQIEQALLSAQAFEPVSLGTGQSQMASRPGDPPLLIGHASGTTANGNQEIRMDYGILDLGAEKLVARYLGPPQQAAFNESVLRASLASLAGQRLVRAEAISPQAIEWSAAPPMGTGQPIIKLPAGWIVEPGAPSPCTGLPQANAGATASPVQDFTIAMRVAVWNTSELVPDRAAAACSSRRGSVGTASYSSRAEWLGVSYSIEGAFTRLSTGGFAQLEVISPDQKNQVARDLLAAWIRRITEP